MTHEKEGESDGGSRGAGGGRPFSEDADRKWQVD